MTGDSVISCSESHLHDSMIWLVNMLRQVEGFDGVMGRFTRFWELISGIVASLGQSTCGIMLLSLMASWPEQMYFRCNAMAAGMGLPGNRAYASTLPAEQPRPLAHQFGPPNQGQTQISFAGMSPSSFSVSCVLFHGLYVKFRSFHRRIDLNSLLLGIVTDGSASAPHSRYTHSLSDILREIRG